MSMKSGSSGSGANSITYQPKKLLKLPKEVPSNIIIKPESNDNSQAPPIPAEQLTQAISAAHSQMKQKSKNQQFFLPLGTKEKSVKIDFNRLQLFKDVDASRW